MKNKKVNIYLDDKPPLTNLGKIMLGASYFILIVWALVILIPLLYMVISSFNGNQERYLVLSGKFSFSFKHFIILFKKTYYLRWVLNTLIVSLSTAALTIFVVSYTGYVYSRFRFKGKKQSLMFIMLIQIIPAFSGIVAYFTLYQIISSIIPIFSRHLMLILIYSISGIAGNTFILKGYMDSISYELDEAAKIDGCSNMKVYRLVIMPIVKPMLAIIFLWSFIGPFLDYLLPSILLSDPKDYTLAAGLFTLISDVKNLKQPVFAAGGLLSSIPIVILFIVLQKQLVSGLSKGSVKG